MFELIRRRFSTPIMHPHADPSIRCVCLQMSLYMALAPDEKLTYREGGPTALATFEAGAEGFTARAFRGCGVVTSDPFEVSDGARYAPPM